MNKVQKWETGFAGANSHFFSFSAFKLSLLIVSSFELRVSTFSLHGAVVQTFNGDTYRGPAVISDSIEITTDVGPIKIALDQITRASFVDSPAGERVPAGLVLSNGTCLAGAVSTLSGPMIEMPSRGLRVPTSLVAWVVYAPFPRALAANLPAGKVGALLPGGDFFEGTLKGADATQCKLLNPIFGLRTFDFRRGELLALVLKEVKPAPVSFEVRTTDDSVFFADSVAPWGGSLTLRGAHFETLSFKLDQIAELRAGTARYQPLTQLKPARLPAPQGFAIDKTLAGEPLANEDGTPARGIESAVGEVGAWEVPAGFTVFSARVRIPDGVPPINKLTFVVYADGRTIYRSPALSSQDPALTVRAPLGTARAMALRLEGVSPANATGRGIWIEPTLLRR